MTFRKRYGMLRKGLANSHSGSKSVELAEGMMIRSAEVLEVAFNRLLLADVRVVTESGGFLPEFCEVGKLSTIGMSIKDPFDVLFGELQGAQSWKWST